MDYLTDDATAFLEEAPFAEGLQNHKDIDNLINELEINGFNSEEIEKITHKNALRVINKIL